MSEKSGRDIVVIGGSAGSIEAMNTLLSTIPTPLPAAIFVVVHSGQNSPAFLPDIFSKHTSLSIRYAGDHDPIEFGTVYIAPPDRHLLVKAGEMRVILGPRENNFRPAIDPLFRTAAHAYRDRVIGIVLSGMLDDGTYGLWYIKQEGGVTIAQTPADASQPSMPSSAIERVGVDYVRPAGEIGALIAELVNQPEANFNRPAPDETDAVEGKVSALRAVPGTSPNTPFICPECGGALWQVTAGQFLHFRCHNGHGFTADTLKRMQDDEFEHSLWSAVRVLEEQAELHHRLAEQHSASAADLSHRFLENARERQQTADVIRTLITGRLEGNPGERSRLLKREYGA